MPALARPLRWTLLTIAILFGFVLAFVIDRLSWLPRSVSPVSGEMSTPGLSGKVRIVRDRNDVPHISGKTANDVYFGLGFVHAQDRLWQMALFRRVLQGRLSALIGPAGLKADRFMHALDLTARAHDSFEHLKPTTQAALRAYAAGVNAWADNPTHRPPQFHLLLTGFRSWKPEDSLLMLDLMQLDLSDNALEEVQRARLIKRLGVKRTNELYPGYPATAPITLKAAQAPASHAELMPAPLLDLLIHLGGASNNWVVDGRFTKSGLPLLANDPHLALRAPGTWYLADLALPTGHAVGATIPGVPAIVLGHNAHVAWGFTDTGADTQDLVVETLDPEDHSRYLTPTGSQAFATHTDTIKVRFGRTRHDTFYESRHGPILPPIFRALDDILPKGKVMALKMTAPSPDDTTMDAAIDALSAQSAAGLKGAFSAFVAPVQNAVYADTAGHIGFITPGRIPIRGPLASPHGLLPSDGKVLAKGELWTGFIPYADLPQIDDPPAGKIFSANNKIVSADYPYFIAAHWGPPYRAMRIGQLLSKGAPWSIADFQRMQMDDHSIAADELVPLLVQAPTLGPREAAAKARLIAWNHDMVGNSPAPLVYISWLIHLQHRIIDDDLGKMAGELRAVRYQFLDDVLTNKDGMASWCDDRNTKPIETCNDMIALALKDAVAELTRTYGADIAAWRWDRAHQARFNSPLLGNVPILDRLFNRRVPTDGGPNTLNRGDITYGGREPYADVHGAGFRGVYDLSDLSRSRFMIAMGQSGNPLSIHYDDLMRAWARGDSFTIPTARPLYTYGSLGTWTLVPAKSRTKD